MNRRNTASRSASLRGAARTCGLTAHGSLLASQPGFRDILRRLHLLCGWLGIFYGEIISESKLPESKPVKSF
jgi:hypothetical protein